MKLNFDAPVPAEIKNISTTVRCPGCHMIYNADPVDIYRQERIRTLRKDQDQQKADQQARNALTMWRVQQCRCGKEFRWRFQPVTHYEVEVDQKKTQNIQF